MPCGITSIINEHAEWRDEKRGKRSASIATGRPRQGKNSGKEYLLIRDLNGKRIYEGFLSNVAARYKMRMSDLKTILAIGSLPGGDTYTRYTTDVRPMEREYTVYSCFENGKLVTSGRHREVIEELGLHPSELSSNRRKLCGGKIKLTIEKKWLPV